MINTSKLNERQLRTFKALEKEVKLIISMEGLQGGITFINDHKGFFDGELLNCINELMNYYSLLLKKALKR